VARPRLVRKLDEQQRRDLMGKQAALVALTKHPSWPIVNEVVEEKVERVESEMLTRAFSVSGITPEQAQFLRGFREGVRYMAKVCAGAEDRLEHILKAEGE
jgi:hypothetical protein